MRSRIFSPSTRTVRKGVGRSVPMIAFTLGLSAMVLTTRTAAQDRTTAGTADPIQAATDSQRMSSKSSDHTQEEISAPVPAQERATLDSSLRVPFLSLEAQQDRNQSPSQSGTSAATPNKRTATKTKPPHHALGVTLAVVGSAALVAGVALYAGEQSISVCNGSSSGCNEAKDAGLALIPIGAGVAVTGFYLQFHH